MCENVCEELLVGTGRGEGDADAGCGLDDTGADLDDAALEGGELGAFQRGALRDGLPDGPQQPVGGGMEDQPELVERGDALSGPSVTMAGQQTVSIEDTGDEIVGGNENELTYRRDDLGCGAVAQTEAYGAVVA